MLTINLIKILLTASIFVASMCSTLSSYAGCTPTPLTKPEAAKLLRFIPEGISAERDGGKLSTVPWDPKTGFRTDAFYLFMLLSSRGIDTPLDNGIIGYFGVNIWTADVLELNAEPPIVEGLKLKVRQHEVIKGHCLSLYASSRRLNDLTVSN